jgi:hypothetical protein
MSTAYTYSRRMMGMLPWFLPGFLCVCCLK